MSFLESKMLPPTEDLNIAEEIKKTNKAEIQWKSVNGTRSASDREFDFNRSLILTFSYIRAIVSCNEAKLTAGKSKKQAKKLLELRELNNEKATSTTFGKSPKLVKLVSTLIKKSYKAYAKENLCDFVKNIEDLELCILHRFERTQKNHKKMIEDLIKKSKERDGFDFDTDPSEGVICVFVSYPFLELPNKAEKEMIPSIKLALTKKFVSTYMKENLQNENGKILGTGLGDTKRFAQIKKDWKPFLIPGNTRYSINSNILNYIEENFDSIVIVGHKNANPTINRRELKKMIKENEV